MTLQELTAQLAASAFSQSIQMTTWAIPAIQTVHIIALALAGSAALIVALRISGAGLVAEPAPQLSARFTRVIWLSLLVLLGSGSLLITAEPGRTLTNPLFYVKMVLLLAVMGLTLLLSAVVRRESAVPTTLLGLGAVASMLLWVGIMFAGRLIAYYESY